MAKSVYCVSIEDDSSGSVDWFYTEIDAVQAYEEALKEFPHDEVNMFLLEFDEELSGPEITDEADTAMWNRDYEPIRWRVGLNHVGAKGHDKTPTDY